jgi:pimeloyl-ACP methyl ester carboxylesterase
MIRAFDTPPMTSPWRGSWPTPWPYRAARISFLEGYQRSLRRRAAYAAARADRLRRSTPSHSSLRRPRVQVEVPDARTRYVDLPQGGRLFVHELAGPSGAPTLILLHGLGGTAAGNWAPSMAALARHFRIIAPNLRGHDLAAVDDVIGLADGLDVERFIAVGYSLGSAVASRLARDHPERVQAIVLCAAAGVSTRSAPTPDDLEVPAAIVVTRQDRLIPAWRQLELARSLPGATVHEVDANHFAFARPDIFVPVLLDACQSVARRTTDHDTTV